MFMGRWLKHAYYPNWNLRLFKHRHGRYEQLTSVATGSGDNEVHEHVVVKGSPGRPKHVYHLSAAAEGLFPKAYGDLTNELRLGALPLNLRLICGRTATTPCPSTR